MALETGTYLDDLVTSNPPQSDSLTQAAGHLRLIKSVLLNTFPNVTGAISATHTNIDGAATAYANGAFVPTGFMGDYGGTTEPSGWLFCNGQAVSRSTYAALFAVIGTTFGAGNTTTTFNVPDRRDRVSIGKADMGGVTDAAIIDSLLTSTTLGATYDGEGAIDTITLTTTHLPAHTHTFSGSGSTDAGGSHSHTFSGTTSSSGSHSHSYERQDSTSGSGSGGNARLTNNPNSTSTSSDGNHSHTFSGTTSTATTHTHTFSYSGTTASSGTGSSFTVDILPPSLVVNVIIKT